MAQNDAIFFRPMDNGDCATIYLKAQIGGEATMMVNEERKLKMAIGYLKDAIAEMEECDSWEERNSGYGAETYGETIENLIIGIKDYLERNRRIRLDFKHSKELIKD